MLRPSQIILGSLATVQRSLMGSDRITPAGESSASTIKAAKNPLLAAQRLLGS